MDRNDSYYRQIFNNNQGTHDADHLWYNLIDPILRKEYGYKQIFDIELQPKN